MHACHWHWGQPLHQGCLCRVNKNLHGTRNVICSSLLAGLAASAFSIGALGAALHAKDSQGIQQPPTSASRDPASGSFHAQPAPDAAALARPETHMPESSGGISAAVAQQGQRTRPALLSQASIGLSLSDAGTSASVLSSWMLPQTWMQTWSQKLTQQGWLRLQPQAPDHCRVRGI